jgi:hypothetical protein
MMAEGFKTIGACHHWQENAQRNHLLGSYCNTLLHSNCFYEDIQLGGKGCQAKSGQQLQRSIKNEGKIVADCTIQLAPTSLRSVLLSGNLPPLLSHFFQPFC